MEFRHNKKPSRRRSAAAAIPPPQTHYTDYLIHRRREWPRLADGRPLTCAELAADTMRNCDFIAHVHAFGMHWLHQLRRPQPQLLPMRLPRALYEVHANAGELDACHSACLDVSAAELVRVRCNEVARVALGLATNCKFFQHVGYRCHLAECIIKRVCDGYCKEVQVRHCLSCMLCRVLL